MASKGPSLRDFSGFQHLHITRESYRCGAIRAKAHCIRKKNVRAMACFALAFLLAPRACTAATGDTWVRGSGRVARAPSSRREIQSGATRWICFCNRKQTSAAEANKTNGLTSRRTTYPSHWRPALWIH